MSEALDAIRDRIGDLSVEALARGGEPMLDQVEGALGVAIRHSDRVARGTMPFTAQVEQEMRASVARAERVLDVRARPLIGI